MPRAARRVLIGLAAGIVITIVTVSAVSAQWHAREDLEAATVSSGSLDIDATWVGGVPTWPALFPGERTPDKSIRVSASGEGDNLRWRLRVESTVSPALTGYVALNAWVGACGTGTPIPAAGIGTFTAPAEVTICVRFTLSTTTPGSLQNTAISPSLVIVAEQVTP